MGKQKINSEMQTLNYNSVVIFSRTGNATEMRGEIKWLLLARMGYLAQNTEGYVVRAFIVHPKLFFFRKYPCE